MATFFFAFAFILLMIFLVMLFIITSALITSPEKRFSTASNPTPEGETNMISALKIWTWEKQDRLVNYLSRRDNELSKSAKMKYLGLFCILGIAFSLTSLFWDYQPEKKPFIKQATINAPPAETEKAKSNDSVIILDQEDARALKQLKEFTKTDTLKENEIPKIWEP